MNIEEIVQKQREYFLEGRTKSINFRMEALSILRKAIKENELEINEALKKDLNKSSFESYMTEVGMTLHALSNMEKNIRKWARKKHVQTPIAQFHGKSFIIPEPYGLTLVIAPWNYPFLLSMEPLIGAIAAGNCCILKPSEYAPSTSAILAKIIKQSFGEQYITVIEGGIEENTILLEQRFDYIFYTGGVLVGKIIMEKASKNLTPITLELGGKSPCIVDETANLQLAAKRIVFGKFLNAGQTCVAPDYLFVHKSVKEEFIKYLKRYIHEFMGENPINCDNYVKIINEKHFNRLLLLMQEEQIVHGGKSDEKSLKIEPTILDHITEQSSIMQEEIFGPILPVMTFDKISEVELYIVNKEKPLALYLFTTNKEVENRILNNVSFGGGCINDTIIHLATSNMPFGGVGNSGMGAYHGKASFDTFSHYKSIIKKYNWIDLPIRYLPYTDLKLKLMKIFLK